MKGRVVAALGLLLVGCGGGGADSATVVFKSPEEETLHLGDVDSRDTQLWAGGFDGTLALPFASTETSKNLGKNPVMTFYVSQRLIGQTAEARFWGVGPFLSSANWSSDDKGTTPLSVSLFIDEWSFTGDGIRPYQIKAHSLPLKDPPQGAHPLLIEVPSLSSRSMCDTGNDGPMFCGGSSVDFVPHFTAKLGELGGSAPCPDEVMKLFVGAGTGANANFSYPSSLRIDGASGSFACVKTDTHPVPGVACGAKGTVASATINGCTWTAFAAAAPNYNTVSKKSWISIWVGANTNDSCPQKASCNSDWFAYEE